MSRLISWLIALAVAAPASAQQTPSVKDFARRPDVLSAKISPNGDYLAVQMRTAGQIGVGVIDLKNMKITGAMAFAHDHIPWRYYWVGPTKIVAEIARSFGPLDQPRLTGELYGMNADGTGKRYIFGYAGTSNIGTNLKRGAGIDYAWASIVDPLPHDPEHFVIQVRPWGKSFYDTLPFIDVMDVETLDRRRVGTSPLYFPDMLTDDTGQPRFVAGTDKQGRCCFLSMRMPGDKAWTPVELPGGPRPEISLASIDRKGETAFLTAPEPDGSVCLYEFRFASKTFTRSRCDALEPDVAVSVADRRPVVLRYEDGLPRVVFPEPEHPDARILRSLQNSFPGQRLSGISHTADGNKLVVLVDSDRSPGDFYLVDRAAKKVDYLIGRSKWIDPRLMQPMSPIKVETRDGVTIHGYVTAREGLKTRNAPLVVLPHGGPHGVRDHWEWQPDVQFLASRGYVVLQVNYRGSGGYGAQYEMAGWRHWGTRMQDDITDAVKWTIAQGIADARRICIYGGSYGGYAALMSATREPDLYRCAVGFAGVYDLVEQISDSDMAESWMGRLYIGRVIGDDEADLREQSPVTHVAKLKAAVLIAHGTDDRRVPFSQAKLLRKALERHQKPYEWLEFSGEEHGFHKDENQEAFYNKLLEFLDKHIGGKTPTGATAGG